MSESTKSSHPENKSLLARGAKKISALLKSKFAKDTVWLGLGMLMVQGTYVITSPLLSRYLSPADFGRYDIAFKIYYFCFFLANMGLINVTVVRYSHAAGSSDNEAKTLALATFAKINLLMAAVILVLGFFLSPLAGERLLHDRSVGFYGWVLCFLGVIDIMRAFSLATLLGARHMKQVSFFEAAIGLVRLLVMVLAVVGGHGIAGIIYGSLIAQGFASIMGLRFYFILRRVQGQERPPRLYNVIKAFPRARMKEFFKLGFMIAINKNIGEFVLMWGAFLMAWGRGFWSTGQFRIATILMGALVLLLNAVTRNFLATLGFKLGVAGKKDVESMGGLFFKVSLVSGLLFAAMTGLFLLAVPWIVGFVYGSEYRESIRLIMIISLSHIFLGFGVIVESFYIYANRLKTQIKINLVIFILIVPSGYLAMRLFGADGVAGYVSVVRGLVLVHLVYIFLYFRRVRAEKRKAPEAGGGA